MVALFHISWDILVGGLNLFSALNDWESTRSILILGFQINFSEQANLQAWNLRVIRIDCVVSIQNFGRFTYRQW